MSGFRRRICAGTPPSHQAAAKFVASLAIQDSNQLAANDATKLETIRASLVAKRVDIGADAQLAATLFTDVLGIDAGLLRQVLDQPVDTRGYTQYFLKQWNDRVFERLDLAHFWQQDDQASLELVYKDQTLYFDITDKTNATYTFKERSSGLRYFLSYYIQAKALEQCGRDRNAVILMDEPDSFLSILGQRNLLAVFESLVGRERAMGRAQLLYTTHSPFLINRNFPRRIRVVVKAEAEEGTQYFTRGSVRRFEPVRSALGIDTAQTLFMGATNLLLEGLTDQYILTEVIRSQITADTAQDYLDLNDVVVVSADGVNNIEKILTESQWGDDPVPATVVMVDGDDAGSDAIADITGESQGKKKLIDRRFCIQLTNELHDNLSDTVLETIEDLIPRGMYRAAFLRYLKKWQGDVVAKHATEIEDQLDKQLLDTSKATVHAVRSVCDSIDGLSPEFDKLGVLQQVIEMLSIASNGDEQPDAKILIETFKALCRLLNQTIHESKQRAVQTSLTANVKRLIREFVRVRTEGCSIIDLVRHLQRLGKEAGQQGVGDELARTVEELERHLQAMERSGQTRLVGDEWTAWRLVLDKVKRDPLATHGKSLTELNPKVVDEKTT